MSGNAKLFRAIVIMGAALTTGPGCDSKCGKTCEPAVDAKLADATPTDAGVSDTPVDVVIIL